MFCFEFYKLQIFIGCVSVKEKNGYTMMLKVINSIGGRNLNYNWLITDIEAYPQKGVGEIDDELYSYLN